MMMMAGKIGTGISYPFPNWREEVANTNPWNPDTDGDSMTDGYEADNG